MKKKILVLALLPLMLSITGCNKDVDPKVKSVTLARLLTNDEIGDALSAVKKKFKEELNTVEQNSVLMNTNLINEKHETSSTRKIEITGDKFAKSKTETTKTEKNDFYSYTNKDVIESKTAGFGKGYLTYTETYSNGKKDDKTQLLNYVETTQSIVDKIVDLPFDENDLNECSIGVDSGNNIYAVYSDINVQTLEGRDKEGKDATFITRSTHEIYIKCGTLKNPKLEKFKEVEKVETNYDEERKVYDKYQIVQSQVRSIQYGYKSRGNDAGRSDFLEKTLPDTFITSVTPTYYVYHLNGTQYELVDTASLPMNATKSDYASNTISFKSNDFAIDKDYAYGFDAICKKVTINKSKETVESANELCTTINLKEHADFDFATFNNKKLYKPKATAKNSYTLKCSAVGLTFNVEII